ncbi:hypothetical protein SAMN05444483_1212 [Salegentibacter echinorum]|uniref:Glycosyltransferase 2-like domain-containing protein n=1 Tax=Salegentibacter echinorum TaxID=1073325 RepID=A0A1M5LLG7_SALEC|nr:glycosyltransferase family A protein [Salegentibacter echinorum]SHG65901.1 hypothetical protein SAMN05444483_1212 [Salegentibacter echinorum]
MKILIHKNSEIPIKVLSSNAEKVELEQKTCTEAFWELAEKYPNEIIGWCELNFEPKITLEQWQNIFHRDLIMASYAVKTTFLSESIGFVDQLPFVNVNRKVKFATWQMSADIGGITGKTLLQFKKRFGHLKDFETLTNSVAKLGQQNGLFCYSAPSLIKNVGKIDKPTEVKSNASTARLFKFVAAHYKKQRLFLLFFCFLYFKKSFPIIALLRAFFQKSHFKASIDLVKVEANLAKPKTGTETIDVIIPTLDRRDYLLQVFEDLENQTHRPKKVIVIEQNPEKNSSSELPELQNKSWPFEVVHHFIHKTGACNARNLALDEVNADWVFFADDDNKMENDILERSLDELKKYQLDMLSLNYLQEGEKLVFGKLKQWGTFGAGNSIVRGKFASKIRFDTAFENGYGEDKDYGMQLRLVGCDIIYHPGLEILHLKAPRGGFRQTALPAWENDQPKPAPTLMLYAQKYYTTEQFLGFKTELFLRYYFKQDIKNPFKYLKSMKKRWRSSEAWARKLRNGVNF